MMRRKPIAFRSVNLRGSPEYVPGLQRHHLLPKQLLSDPCFGTMIKVLGKKSIGFDDFRANGILLPANEAATKRTGMPLHRGPYKRYNEIVIERVGRIEAKWSVARAKDAEAAERQALKRLKRLQSALRWRLLRRRKGMVLNRKDPLGTGFDFTELDAMAEELWAATGSAASPAPSAAPAASSASAPAPECSAFCQHQSLGCEVLAFHSRDEVLDAPNALDRADPLTGPPDVLPCLGLGVAAAAEVHLRGIACGKVVGIQSGVLDRAAEVVPMNPGEQVRVDDAFGRSFDNPLFVGGVGVGLVRRDEGASGVTEVCTQCLCSEDRAAVCNGPG